jgi:hypothetical protein
VSVGSRVHCVRPGVGRGGAGAGSRMAGMAGVGVVACGVHGQFVVGPGRSLAVEPGRRLCWASGGVGLDLAVVVGGGWVVARSSAWATRIGWMCWGIVRWVASRGAQRGSDYPAWSSCED